MSAQPAKPLTFSGLQPGIIPWTLFGFIILSAIVHAFGFYIFQTIYPPAAHVSPPPVQVGLITPGMPGADGILRWINSEDPAVTAQPASAPIPALNALPYIPSFATVHARPAMVPTTEPPLPYPSGASGLDLVKLATARPVRSPPVPGPVPTTLGFTGPLNGAALDPLPSFDLLREGAPGDLQPARFLLGVSRAGEVQYVFIQDSSGDKGLDATASRLLERVKFQPGAADIQWGFATFFWGSAVYGQPSPSAGVSP